MRKKITFMWKPKQGFDVCPNFNLNFVCACYKTPNKTKDHVLHGTLPEEVRKDESIS